MFITYAYPHYRNNVRLSFRVYNKWPREYDSIIRLLIVRTTRFSTHITSAQVRDSSDPTYTDSRNLKIKTRVRNEHLLTALCCGRLSTDQWGRSDDGEKAVVAIQTVTRRVNRTERHGQRRNWRHGRHQATARMALNLQRDLEGGCSMAVNTCEHIGWN